LKQEKGKGDNQSAENYVQNRIGPTGPAATATTALTVTTFLRNFFGHILLFLIFTVFIISKVLDTKQVDKP
jgi:hypothetical protein